MLPPEIVLPLLLHIPQADFLHLAQTCRELHDLLIHKLYSAIVIGKRDVSGDSLHSGSLFLARYLPVAPPRTPTVVTSLFALSQLFRTVIKKRTLATCIRYIVFTEAIPDIPSIELITFLSQIFPSLGQLQVLSWYADLPLDQQLLTLLPRPENLLSLCGNIQLCEQPLKFANLTHLDVSRFGAERYLDVVDLEDFPNLKALKLSKTASSCFSHCGSDLPDCCETALSGVVEAFPAREPGNAISRLFLLVKSRLVLTEFTLKDITVTSDDAKLLTKSVDLLALRSLTLNNCYECIFADTRAGFTRRTPPQHMFLDILAPHLENLNTLLMSLPNDLCFNAPVISLISRISALEKLSMHLKYPQSSESLDLSDLVKAIQCHSHSLRHLDICCDKVRSAVAVCPKKDIQIKLPLLVGLIKCSNLQYLKLPVTHSQLTELHKILKYHRKVETLEFSITDISKLSMCNSCNIPRPYLPVSCLISQDYFSCPTQYTQAIFSNNSERYMPFCEKVAKELPRLRNIHLHLKEHSYVYETFPGTCSPIAR